MLNIRKLTLTTLVAASQFSPAVEADDRDDLRELIRDARELVVTRGDQVWNGFSDAPFGILLIDESDERLFCHSGSADGFEFVGMDPVLSCPSHVRPASFPPNMLASFPAVDGVPTIVVGTPEGTGLTPSAWVLTIVHEHFHQLQFAWPEYYPGTSALGLSNNDDSGMWMLNYPFPYTNHETVQSFRTMADRLKVALDERGTSRFDDAFAQYWEARESARQTVSDDDWRYVELQFWQEGVARWTEWAVAAGSDTYSDAARAAYSRVVRELEGLDLAAQGRSAVYPLGAGEAMLLESIGQEWRSAYWSAPFSLGPQLMKHVRQQGSE